MKRLPVLALSLMLVLSIAPFAEGQKKDQNPQKDGFDDQTLYKMGYTLKHITPVTPELNELTIKCLMASIEMGNSEAMIQMGEMYLAGRVPLEAGMDTNQEAIKLWNLGWEKGAKRAYHNLGLLYYGVAVPGTGGAGVGVVKQDYNKAFQYFKSAADLGDTKALRYTGICYENGHGVKQDYEQAAWYYQKIGGYYYANLLLEGKGITQDIKKALEIYETVAARDGGGDEDQYAAFALARIYENGIYVKRDLNKASEYYQNAAGKGSEAAKSKLAEYSAQLYKEGFALLEAGKYESALPMLLKSATLGNSDALKMTGIDK